MSITTGKTPSCTFWKKFFARRWGGPCSCDLPASTSRVSGLCHWVWLNYILTILGFPYTCINIYIKTYKHRDVQNLLCLNKALTSILHYLPSLSSIYSHFILSFYGFSFYILYLFDCARSAIEGLLIVLGMSCGSIQCRDFVLWLNRISLTFISSLMDT